MKRQQIILIMTIGAALLIGSFWGWQRSVFGTASTVSPLSQEHQAALAVPITEIEEIAKKELTQWDVPGMLAQNGVLSQPVVLGNDNNFYADVSLSHPVKVLVLPGDQVATYTVGKSDVRNIAADPLWYEIPVLYKGKPSLTVTIAYFEGRWQIIRLGGGPAVELVKLQELYAKKGETLALVRFDPTATLFVLVPKDGTEMAVHLRSLDDELAKLDNMQDVSRSSYKLYTPDQIMESIKASFIVLEQQRLSQNTTPQGTPTP